MYGSCIRNRITTFFNGWERLIEIQKIQIDLMNKMKTRM